MGKKDFKRGMEAGAKPFEDKFKQVSEAVERVGTEIKNKIGDIKETVDIVIDDLSSIQKKELYDLSTQFDIKELEQPDKELLIAGLYTLSAMSDNLTDCQKAFIRSVQKYTGVKNPQTSVDLSVAIENIESVTVQKAVMQAFMEFLFLENEDNSFLEDYAELFEFFSVTKKGREVILDSIKKVYHATGALGISEKYGYVPEVLKSQGTTPSSASSVITREIDNTPPPGLELFHIDKEIIVGAGETLRLENKNIYLNNDIKCSGVLEFVNCKITSYMTTDGLKGRISYVYAKGKNKISFENCLITCEIKNKPEMTFDINHNNQCFLISTGDGGLSAVEFNNCTIADSPCLLHVFEANVFINHSCIENPMGDFIKSSFNKNIVIENTEIKFNKLESLDIFRTNLYGSGFFGNNISPVFDVSTMDEHGTLSVSDCKFISDGSVYADGKGMELFKERKNMLDIKNCEFINLQQPFGDCNSIKNCFFSNCKDLNIHATKVIDCIFEGCSQSLITNGEIIKGCQFINILVNTTPGHGKNSSALYFDEWGSKTYSSKYSNDKTKSSRVEDCLFNGITLNEKKISKSGIMSKNSAYIIQGFACDTLSTMLAVVKNCTFKNCKTDNPKNIIIYDHDTYYVKEWFKDVEKNQKIIEIRDCEGLDLINKQVEDVIFEDNKELRPGEFVGVSNQYECYGLPESWMNVFLDC
jgi:hypothetical protein